MVSVGKLTDLDMKITSAGRDAVLALRREEENADELLIEWDKALRDYFNIDPGKIRDETTFIGYLSMENGIYEKISRAYRFPDRGVSRELFRERIKELNLHRLIVVANRYETAAKQTIVPKLDPNK